MWAQIFSSIILKHNIKERDKPIICNHVALFSLNPSSKLPPPLPLTCSLGIIIGDLQYGNVFWKILFHSGALLVVPGMATLYARLDFPASIILLIRLNLGNELC